MVADNSAVEESSEGYLTLEGKVIRVQTGSRFNVAIEIQGQTFHVNAHLKGKLKMHKIRIVQNDIVILEVLVSDLMNSTKPSASGKTTINGRITQRKDAHRMAIIENNAPEGGASS